MNEHRVKTSMSVMEMGKLLGIGKTDAYWLIKKKPFEIIIVDKKMRIMIDSFEKWYAAQPHYHKVASVDLGKEE